MMKITTIKNNTACRPTAAASFAGLSVSCKTKIAMTSQVAGWKASEPVDQSGQEVPGDGRHRHPQQDDQGQRVYRPAAEEPCDREAHREPSRQLGHVLTGAPSLTLSS